MMEAKMYGAKAGHCALESPSNRKGLERPGVFTKS